MNAQVDLSQPTIQLLSQQVTTDLLALQPQLQRQLQQYQQQQSLYHNHSPAQRALLDESERWRQFGAPSVADALSHVVIAGWNTHTHALVNAAIQNQTSPSQADYNQTILLMAANGKKAKKSFRKKGMFF